MPRILIVVPTPFELRLVLSLLQDHDCADGDLQSPLLCGFGPIAAAARTVGLITERQPDRVLLIGIAGTYDPETLPIGRASQFAEVACHGIGVGSGPSFLSASQLGWSQFSGAQFEGTQFSGTQRCGIDVEPERGDQFALQTIGAPDVRSTGLLLTCCAASANESEALERCQRYPTALAEDMEGFGVAMACAMTGVPLSIVRGISNRAGDRDRNHWQVEFALAAAVEIAVNLVEQVREEAIVNSPTTHAELHRIRLGISTCPNDTFAFHALINRSVNWRGLEFVTELMDIQQLNDRLFADQWDVAKASFHAALLLADRTVVLSVGSALGFGVGPLLLASHPETVPSRPSQLALCPGRHTTAALLFSLFHPQTARVEHCVFSEIMPRLKQGSADFGVCIHEGRFTWQREGLSLVEDLGTRWERATGSPLPLGGILASRRLPPQVIDRVQAVIRDSLLYALEHRDEALVTMRKYAQDLDDHVLMQHVDLYVNRWTVDLEQTGRGALKTLSQRAKSIGLLESNAPELFVWPAIA